MVKFLMVDMPDNTRWKIPAEVIAQSRAAYYADHDSSKDGGGVYDEIYREEYEYALNDDTDELIDWAQGNMNWSDLQVHAVQIEKPIPVPDYQKWWGIDTEMKVVESW